LLTVPLLQRRLQRAQLICVHVSRSPHVIYDGFVVWPMPR
jgi:hypothetical protein